MIGQTDTSGGSLAETVITACFGAIGLLGGVLGKVFWNLNQRCDRLEKEVEALEREVGELRTENALLRMRIESVKDETK